MSDLTKAKLLFKDKPGKKEKKHFLAFKQDFLILFFIFNSDVIHVP